MSDRMLARAWWTAIMSLLFVTAMGSLFSGYRGLFALCGGDLLAGATHLLIALPLGAAAYLLCRHRVDLVCD
jgi:hypothetical protein